MSSFEAYEDALGIKSVSWAPSSQFLAVGSYDQTVRMILWSSLFVCLLFV